MSEAPDEHRLPSLFASASWEPRFAFDHAVTLDAVDLALRLHLACHTSRPRVEAAKFRGYRLSPTRIAVAAQVRGFPSKLREAEPMFEELDRSDAAEAIVEWLKDHAEYPSQPWFDGGEARGFQASHVPYGERSFGPYGYMIVEPKWFEVHK